MNRQLFANTSLDKHGRPLYDVEFKNMLQDPSEVAKSKRYFLERRKSQTNNVSDNTTHEDFTKAIEKDWMYGNTKFTVTYGPLVTQNFDKPTKTIAFSGYWS
jgi:hypothetical protein